MSAATAMPFSVTVPATSTVTVAFAVLMAVTTTASALLLALRLQFGGDQFTVFKLGDGLRDHLRVRSVNCNALRHQHAQRHAINGTTEYSVHTDALVGLVFVRLQRNVLVLTGFGVKKDKCVGLMQIRLNCRFDALVVGYRNA